MSIVLPFSRDFDCEYGVADAVAPGLRRIVANNPSPFTFKGTNSYIVGTGMVAVIDPGPDDEAHRSALLAELARGGERVSHIFLTHTHKDHSAGTREIRRNHRRGNSGFRVRDGIRGGPSSSTRRANPFSTRISCLTGR